MKKVLMLFAVIAVLAAGSCKKGVKNDYVEQVQGKWTVTSISPEVPVNAYVVEGDQIEFKSDLTYTIDNHWGPFFTDKIWTLAFDPQNSSSYLYLQGVNNEKLYTLLVGNIAGMTQNNMYLEYKDETGTYYRYTFTRVTGAK